MKTVKKYNSFEELKSADVRKIDNESVKSMHLEFEKAILAIISEKTTNADRKHNRL